MRTGHHGACCIRTGNLHVKTQQLLLCLASKHRNASKTKRKVHVQPLMPHKHQLTQLCVCFMLYMTLSKTHAPDTFSLHSTYDVRTSRQAWNSTPRSQLFIELNKGSSIEDVAKSLVPTTNNKPYMLMVDLFRTKPYKTNDLMLLKHSEKKPFFFRKYP